MPKFGDLIDVEVPVLLEFFTEWDKSGEMKWRQNGEEDANTLIGRLQEYV